ncbi:M24 family metallopeptidase [Terriglobus aquaticus]|uniref:M24 family metallopeptidase n=1 Tax=Terriglobus aquaticus TaxID=940139 RepID=A0ABW9KKV6_9BACT|nr:aminopeptidase P family protein [Terriglobus aquaticus]
MLERLRWKRLADHLRRNGSAALLVTHLPDVRYLCGFTGSSAALAIVVGPRGLRGRLFTDGRYRDQAASEVTGASVTITRGSPLPAAAKWLAAAGAVRCDVDAAHTSIAAQKQIVKILKGTHSPCRLRAVVSPVARLREVKDDIEQERLAAAARLGCELYDGMLTFIEPGMTEVEVAAELEYRARKAGAEGMSFETIVASGTRSSMPHARATANRIEAGALLTLDFGIMLDGYCSDMTRTLQVGQGTSRVRQRRQREVFEAVLAAQEAAVASVRHGVTAEAVDTAARNSLKAAGLAKWFTHSTGHGLGLEIHEGPRIAAKQTEPLCAGMVITIEPGVYLTGEFGVRIEDTVRVTEEGCEILTPAYKGWLEL